jgi:hypothetical protein
MKSISMANNAFMILEELNLSFDENNIHFRFVAVNLDRRPLQLSYRLEGQDQDWVSSFSGTTATYANLDPGQATRLP